MAMSAEEFTKRQRLAAQYGAPPASAAQAARRFAAASASSPQTPMPTPTQVRTRKDMEPWVLGNEMGPPKPPTPLQAPTPEQVQNWQSVQAASKAAPPPVNTHPVAGALATAFPQASLLLGGASEMTRRANIYDSGSPMAPPKPPVSEASAPITPAPAAPAPATAPQKTPEQVFSDLQRQRGFTPLGGVDPNAVNPPTLFQRTDAIHTRPGSANPNDVQALQNYRRTGFNEAQQGVAAAQEALRRNPNDPQARQQLARAEADFTGAQQALAGAQGPLERRQYAGPGGSVSGVVAQGTPRGGFGGAATDAEAARNLQARFEQDAAASQIAAGFDRETERLRDARAEKMGISRAKLDASEGRSNPLTDLFAPQGQPTQTEAFSQPGDGFGDAAMRRSVLERRMADTRTSGSERRAAAEAYKGFLSPAHGTGSGGPANGHSPDLFTMVDKLRDNQRADQNLALQGQQLQETRRSNAFNQALNATKEDRAAREQFRVQGKEAEQAVVKDRTQFIKDFTDPKTKRGPDMGALDVLGTQLARSPSLQQADPAMAARFLDGSARYEDLVKVRQMQRIYEESRPGLSTLYLGSPASADEIVQRYFQLNAPQL